MWFFLNFSSIRLRYYSWPSSLYYLGVTTEKNLTLQTLFYIGGRFFVLPTKRTNLNQSKKRRGLDKTSVSTSKYIHTYILITHFIPCILYIFQKMHMCPESLVYQETNEWYPMGDKYIPWGSPRPAVCVYIYMNERPVILRGGYISIYHYIYHYITRYFTVVVLYFLQKVLTIHSVV